MQAQFCFRNREERERASRMLEGMDLDKVMMTEDLASGNLLFVSKKGELTVKRELEAALGDHMGKTVEVMVRTAREMEQAVAANPFAGEAGP